MANAFITIGTGTGSWCTREDPENPGEYLKYAPSSYQICVGVNNCGIYNGPYWEYYKTDWFQGSWFVRSPLMENMLRDDFIALMTKVNKTIQSKYKTDREHCPVFKGTTYSEVYVQVEKCFQEIISLLKSETGSEDWAYDEGPCGPTIENSLKYADKFVENFKAEEKKKKYQKAHNVKKWYKSLIKDGYSTKEAMKMLNLSVNF
jgi:hypothetical protein